MTNKLAVNLHTAYWLIQNYRHLASGGNSFKSTQIVEIGGTYHILLYSLFTPIFIIVTMYGEASMWPNYIKSL